MNFKCLKGSGGVAWGGGWATTDREEGCGDQISSTSSQSSSCEVKHQRLEIESFVR